MFASYAKASLLACAAAAPVSALADFSGPYTVTPPGNGIFVGNGAAGAFGSWTGTWNGFGSDTLNTLGAPASINMSISNGAVGGNIYSFLVTAAAAGLVSFNFTAFSAGGTVAFLNQTTAMSSSLTGNSVFSMSVNAGDIFGFRLTANYMGTASLTLSNFSAPVPTTSSVPEQGSSLALLALGFVGLLAHRTAIRPRAVARA